MMKSTLKILFLSLCWCMLFLSLGVFAGWIRISVPVPWLLNPAAFVYRHLRLSIVPFGCLLLFYSYLIGRIRQRLQQEDARLSELTYYDRLLNATIATFFGVGVIWTAIGMEGALMQALGGIHEDGGSAGNLSALSLMERLVNGGLLLALSTTVFGGVCGYLLRLTKIVLIGRSWDRFILGEEGKHGQTETP